RFSRDWSSDVCSSDLADRQLEASTSYTSRTPRFSLSSAVAALWDLRGQSRCLGWRSGNATSRERSLASPSREEGAARVPHRAARSVERRVGKDRADTR